MPTLNKKIVGYVPDKLKYVQRAPSQVADYWEHDLWGDEKPPSREVRGAFVVDASNDKTLKTAMEWAGHARWNQKGGKPTIEERDNAPIESIEVVSLDIRGNGGRAWKVLIENTFYADLREDVMLDALRHGEGVKLGFLKGPFIWCGVGTQMKLVRVGSKLHDVVLAAGKRKAAPNVKKFALEVGGVYENRKGERSMYLGQVDTEYVTDANYEENRRRSSYQSQLPLNWKVTAERNYQLWVELKDYRPTLKSVLKRDAANRLGDTCGWCYWSFTTVKNRTVAGGMVEFEKVPADIFERIHQIGRDLVAHGVDKTNAAAADPGNARSPCYTPVEVDRANQPRMAHGMRYLVMRPAGTPRPEAPEIKALLDKVRDQFTP